MKNRQSRSNTFEFSSLEPRNLLAGITFDAASGIIEIDGSGNPDQVYVFDHSATQIQVVFDGVDEQEFEKSDVVELIFRARSGDDHFENQTNIVSRAYGHAGNDTLIGGFNNDRLRGGKGNDRIEGRGGADYIGGGGHDDLIFAGLGNDFVKGLWGNDAIFGQQGDDFIDAGDGDDLVNGGDGNDQILGRNGNDRLLGGQGDDHIKGMNGDDIIEGNIGNDSLYGNGGRDVVYGGLDDDMLYGGSSSDDLHGHAGLDLVFGGPGNDDLYGGADSDVLNGGAGNDDYDSDILDDVFDDSDDTSFDGDFEVRGNVTNFNATNQSFRVLGLLVNYSNAEFVANIQDGSFVKVEGNYNGNVIDADEVEIENDDRFENFEARGIVEDLNAAGQSFSFFGFNVNYSGAEVQGQLSNGDQILLEGRLTGNQVQANRIESSVDDGGGNNGGGDQGDNQSGDIELRGVISNFDASANTFSLLGLTIDFSGAQLQGSLANGSFVKVDGRIGQNQVIAHEVEIEIDDQDENFEGIGEVRNLNTSNQTFELFGFLVDYANAELDVALENNLVVEVEGFFANGNIDAAEIR